MERSHSGECESVWLSGWVGGLRSTSGDWYMWRPRKYLVVALISLDADVEKGGLVLNRIDILPK
jgi:hypothetical protein